MGSRTRGRGVLFCDFSDGLCVLEARNISQLVKNLAYRDHCVGIILEIVVRIEVRGYQCGVVFSNNIPTIFFPIFLAKMSCGCNPPYFLSNYGTTAILIFRRDDKTSPS